MSNHRILNLPEDPFISDEALQQAIVSCGPEMAARDKVYFDVDQLIKPEILESFAVIGLKPAFLLILHRPGWFASKVKFQENTKVHTDLTGVDGKYIKVPFAVNWQLTPGETFFSWWDTKDADEVWPAHPPVDHTVRCYLNSILYNSADTFEYKKYDCTETVKFEKPMLVRTDRPHSVIYNTGDQVRLSISIRFNVANTPDWDTAVRLFEPLTVK
jgi:hypothetical protein